MTDTPLSDDAKALFGAIFGMSKIGSDALTFHMNDSRPTARAQAALGLVEQGRITNTGLALIRALQQGDGE